jgi:hypothetical protein
MYRDRRDAWADALLWGGAAAILLVIAAVGLALYFNWWTPLGL